MKLTFSRIVFFLSIMLIALPAHALDLSTARTQGSIGEKVDGYVTALSPAADVQALVDQINAKRRAEYARISKENGQPLSVVGTLAAGQIIAKLPQGAKYQDASGHWKTK